MVVNLSNKLAEELEEAYDIISKTNLVIFKWTLSEEIPTDFVSDNIAQFGYQPEDFYTGKLKDYWEFVHPLDRERVKQELYYARENGRENYKNQYRVICANGDVKHVEEWVIHERNEAGTLLLEKGVLRDITESVAISEKLKESESRYKELFDNASALIMTFKENGYITEYNNSFKHMMSLHEAKHPLKIDDFLADSTKALCGEQSFFEFCKGHLDDGLEIEMISLNGEKYAIELHNRIIYKDDTVFEMQAVGNDITAKKRAEEKVIYLTEHDTLTGVYNRLYFDKKITELEHDEKQGLSIIVGDVNGLKMVNDGFGHKMGDQMLIAIADVLKQIFNKPGDVISRLSGDEFAIITYTRNVQKCIEKIQSACMHLIQFPFVVDISLGYAIRKKMTQSLDSVFREADHEMYRVKLRRTKRVKLNMIESLKAQLESKNIETTAHSSRMTQLALKIGAQLGFNESLMEDLQLAISMHDIGMVSIDREIVAKNGKLTEEEYKEVMKHSEIGYHLLIATPSLASIGEYVLSHHENFDGSGYPQGLKGIEIPVISRIISIVDGYDAMTQDKPYRHRLSHESALDNIQQNAGVKYDPSLVSAFETIFDEMN